ncbi:MAG TPA: hypothetical protein VLL03_04370 [Burkholderiales bacterium]|nr:hypothetical protein [Burkholderiales bacterium]
MRRFLSIVSRFTLGLMLFAKLSLVVHACMLAGNQPASALDPHANAPCHQAGSFNPNVCLSHCTESNQSTAAHMLPALPAATLAVLSVTPVKTAAALQTQTAAQSLNITDPPRTIRFCCFLN